MLKVPREAAEGGGSFGGSDDGRAFIKAALGGISANSQMAVFFPAMKPGGFIPWFHRVAPGSGFIGVSQGFPRGFIAVSYGSPTGVS